MSAKWIWYSGDFEQYHSMLLHSRRTEYDYGYPPMWHVSRPESACFFVKEADLPEGTIITAVTRGNGYVELDGKRIGGVNTEIRIPKGKHRIAVKVQNLETFPSIYIDNPYFMTDESWHADLPGEAPKKAAACEPVFTEAADDPSVFPFSHKEIQPVSVKPVNSGILYDFGVESFGPVTVNRTLQHGKVDIIYGESEEEALDPDYAYLRIHVPGGEGAYRCPGKAFRYIFIRTEQGDAADVKLQAELEYLPLQDIASFESDDPALPKIWEICARAFHLNSREFFLDGIKRDRWCWAGDAYQSYMVNRYLYNDPAITKRTIRALLDKQPYRMHINTINDYSAYMFLGVWEYYFATGDRAFVAEVWDNLKALYHFITGRLDPKTGYVTAQPGDWVFIDWHDFDREGPLCAEQILLHEVYRSMAGLSELMGEPDSIYLESAGRLKREILRDFWDDKKGAFIDSCTSGRRHVTRHANIFAILYDFVDENTQQELAENILLKNEAASITTPFFKLFELMALGKCGYTEVLQDYIDTYWGGMIANGATSAWEEFIPEKKGAEHYEMYGDKYGCSLCHAWGAGPILLLGRYIAGVRPISVGTESFEAAPAPGHYKEFKAVVPIGRGSVTVEYKNGNMTAYADIPGGVLRWNGKETPIPIK